jgi:hypothetical protein
MPWDGKYPRIGQDVYVGSILYLTHGRDDFAGGLCRIVEIFPDDPSDGVFVEVEEDAGTRYSWKYLMENQDDWRERYGDRRGHPDPDWRPEFNEE